jgi:hypothetical protein
MEVIFLPTVRHSGTWFLQKLFQTGGFKVVNLDRMLCGGEHIPPNGKAIIHTHIDVNLKVIRAMHASHPKPAHHLAINFYGNLNAAMIESFNAVLPTLVPMRDPLLSIITRHTRHPEQAPHTYLATSWRYIPDDNVFFVPVDLPFSPARRENVILNALNHCGVVPWPGVETYAREWKPVNSVFKPNEARAAYARRDKGWFEENFPEEWAALRSSSAVRSLFEEQGYEDLLWW